MNRFFRRLPLPVKLMLIGLVPFLFLVYLSVIIYSDRSQTLSILDSFIERVRESSRIGQLIEELQKERRYSFIYSTTGKMPPELILQRKVTDSIIQSVKRMGQTDLKDFTEYTFLKDLDKTRRLIDTVPAMGGELGMSYYTNAIFRLNTLNVFPVESGRHLDKVNADIVSEKIVSQMITYLGIIRANIYNVLYTRQNAQNTLFGLRGGI